MIYSKTKRDIKMHQRRQATLVMPDQPVIEIILGKYQANEARVQKVVQMLQNPSSTVTSLVINQNQFTDKQCETLCKAIKMNTSLENLEINRCRLRTHQLAMICNAVSDQASEAKTCPNTPRLNNQKFNKFGSSAKKPNMLESQSSQQNFMARGDVNKTGSITRFKLSQLRINMEGAKAISKMVSESLILNKLYLVDTGIDCDTLEEICKGIQNSESLEYLDLKQNIFDKRGVRCLIDAVSTNMTVKHIYLEGVAVHAGEAKLLAEFIKQDDCMLEELEINEADIDVEALDIIMEALLKRDTLIKLSLAKNELDQTICQHLSKLPSHLHKFQSLCLSHCLIGMEGLQCICEGLAGDVSIRYLDLSWNFISNEGMTYILEMLKENRTLRKLYIQHNNLEEQGAKQMVQALIVHPQMKYLDISANNIGSNGFLYFKELFETNHTLRNLHVRKNHIGAEIVDELPLSLMDNTNLKYLDLQDNVFNNNFAENLMKVLQNNITIEDLELGGNNFISQGLKDSCISEVRKNLLIKEYILSNLGSLSEFQEKKILQAANKNRQSQMFQSQVISRRTSFKIPREREKLMMMKMETVQFKSKNFWRTDFISKFLDLYKGFVNKLEFQDVTVVNRFKDLGNFLQASDIQLRYIKFDKVTGLSDNDLNLLIINVSKLKSLEELTLSRMGIKGPKAFDEMDDNFMSRCALPATQIIAENFSNHPNLKKLDLCNNQIERFDDIAKLIALNKVISTLNLTGNPISNIGCLQPLAQAMQQNLTILNLILDIEKIPTLRRMSKTSKEEEDFVKFIDREQAKNQFISDLMLRKKWTLQMLRIAKVLDVSAQQVSSFLDAIFKLFEQLPNMKDIKMQYCDLGDDQLSEIIIYIFNLTHELEELDLSHNQLTIKSATHLATLLGEYNYPVKRIALNNNQEFSTEGFMKIMNAISMNQFIQTLEFEACGITLMDQDVGNKVKNIVSKNCSLQNIRFDNNKIDETLIKDIQEQLKQNKNINDIIFNSLKQQNKEALQRMQKHEIQKKEKIKKKFRQDFEMLTYSKMGIAKHIVKKERKSRKSVRTNNITSNDLINGLSFKPFKTIESEGENESVSNSSSTSGDDQRKNIDENQQVLNLRGKGLSDLNFLEKFMRENQNHNFKVDIADNDINDNQLKKFIDMVKSSSNLTSFNITGLKNIRSATKTHLKRELELNKNISKHLLKQDMRSGHISLKSQKLGGISFLNKFLHQNVNLSSLKVIDLGDNNLGKENAQELCHLIEMKGTVFEKIILSNNRINSKALQHICSSLVSNETILELDISNNQIDDESYKVLYSLLQKNTKINSIIYSLTNEKNIKKQEKFQQLKDEKLSAQEIEDRLRLDHEEDHDHEMTFFEKINLPLRCWRSFIHDKHEAFRFKYATKQLNILDEKLESQMKTMYINIVLYYLIMIVCPLTFKNKCGKGISEVSHIIYSVYSILSFIFEIRTIFWIKNLLNNDQLLKINKWHFVELLFGQIARFDTYLDVCFWILLLQCGEKEMTLSIPVGCLIFLYLTYPIYSVIKIFFWKRDKVKFQHTQPNIEKICKLSFVRENMMVATVLDSFCVVNNNELCNKDVTFGRSMAIWTLLTQDGPQYLIHILYLLDIPHHSYVPHYDQTVIMSLCCSSIAVCISIFNIVMCAPNEFDPIVLQIELHRRQEEAKRVKEENLNLATQMESKLAQLDRKSKMQKQSVIINQLSGFLSRSKTKNGNSDLGTPELGKTNVLSPAKFDSNISVSEINPSSPLKQKQNFVNN